MGDLRSSSPGDMAAAAADLIVADPVSKAVPGQPAPVVPAAQAQQPAANAGAPPIAQIIVKSPLGDQTYGDNPLDKVVLTSFEDVKNFAKDYIGADIKDVKDLVPVFEKVKELESVVTKAQNLEQQLTGLNSLINNLPPEVALIVQTSAQGGDYMSVINNLQKKSSLDYSKPFEAHDTLQLVNHYTGKQFTKEAFDALDPISKETLTSTIKMQYSSEKDKVVNFESDTKRSMETKQQQFTASIDASIAKLIASNPKMDKAAVERVRQRMLYGLSDALFTADKTYKPEAASKIAMMEFGEQIITAQAQTIGDIVRKIKGETSNDVLQGLILRSDVPVSKGGKADANVIAAAVDRETSFLSAK